MLCLQVKQHAPNDHCGCHSLKERERESFTVGGGGHLGENSIIQSRWDQLYQLSKTQHKSDGRNTGGESQIDRINFC